ncbi:MAG: BlaI/MecI/CopY family transcriptional regulator [Spongiibacteraceae bacterium]
MNLGELEKLVLQHIWDTGEVDAKQVFAHFEKTRGGTLNTIQSTLDRLYKKNLLSREKQGHAYLYKAAINRNAFIGQLINDIASDFGSTRDSPLLAAFSSLTSDLDNEQLDELERLIEEKRAASRAGGNQ